MNIVARRTSLQVLLGVPGSQLRIPPYQRPYAWGDEHVDELWDDLKQSLGRGHFMGSLVLTGEESSVQEVIDGQQRITTLMVLLGLIRDRARVLDPEAVGRIQTFLMNTYAEGERRFKLRTGEANWPVFRDFVLKSPADATRKQWSDVAALDRTTRSRNAGLIANAERLGKALDSWLSAAGQTEHKDMLRRMENAILSQLEFVVISVPTLADAFVIFETLNDRGLALSAGDLLKNHLLQKAAAAGGEDVEDLASDWEELLACLQEADITRFLRHYLLVRHARVQKDDVFDLFKKDVAARGPRPLLAELLTMARWYGQFVDPTTAEHEPTRSVLRDLQTLRATMCYSALLAARMFPQAIDEAAFVRLARIAEVLTFRFSTICSKDSKELERVYHQAAKLIWDTQGTAFEDACSVLAKAMPGTDEFVSSFRYQSMGRKYVIDYVLRKIETHFEPEEKEVKGTRPVHLEHIMPQSLTGEWKIVLGDRLDEYSAYVNRWGNLTLLGGRKNITASNRTFAEKCNTYAESAIVMTQRLTTLTSWDLDTIDTRQNELATLADQIWAKPGTMAS